MTNTKRAVPHQGYQALYGSDEATTTAIVAVEPEPVSDAETMALAKAIENGVSVADALHVTTHFATSARRGSTAAAVHRLTWFTGNNKCRSVNGKALPDIAGWAIEQPDLDESPMPEDFDLHDAMSLLCEQGLAAEVIVQHQDEQGKPRHVKYWALTQASLFVVCEGVPSKGEMLKDVEVRWGVAYAWPEGRGSELHFVAFVKELMDAGYHHAFFVKFSSYCTDRALACLKSHERVLNVADKLRRDRAGENEGVAYYAYAIPVVVSTRTITAGKEANKTKEVYYPVPAIPRQVTVEYLANVAITAEQAFLLEEDGYVERMVEWSVEKSKRILAGKEAETSEASNGDDGSTYMGVDLDGKPIPF